MIRQPPTVFVFAAALWAASCSSAAAPDPAPAGETQGSPVAVQFAWPSDLRIEVTYESLHTAGDQQQRFAMRYVLVVTEVEDGLAVDAGDWQTPPGATPAGALSPRDLVERLLSTALPRFVVSRQGALRRVEGVTLLQTRLLDTLERQGKRLAPDDLASARTAIRMVVTEESMTARLAEWWSLAVGMWSGRVWTVGEVVRERSAILAPPLGSVAVEAEVERTHVGPARCSSTDDDESCLLLRYRCSSDPASVAAVVKVLAEAAAEHGDDEAKAALETIETLELGTEVEILTTAQTLVPRRIEQRRWMRLQTRAGETREEHRKDTLVFSVAPAP